MESVKMEGISAIVIAPGGSLKLYVGGPSAEFNGLGVNNVAGKAENFYYYGLPGNTSVTIKGNAISAAAIYAPNADLKFNGNGNLLYHFIGGIIASTATLNGHFNFPYDEHLAR